MNDNNQNGFMTVLLLGLVAYLTIGQGKCQGPPPPVTTGPRAVVILYETAEQTPELARTIADLRTGESQQFLTAGNHVLTILDDDLGTTPTDKAEAAAYNAAKAKGPPSIGIAARSDASVIYSAVFDTTSTAAQVIATIREHGG